MSLTSEGEAFAPRNADSPSPNAAVTVSTEQLRAGAAPRESGAERVKDGPERLKQSTEELAADISHAIAEEPVEAPAPTSLRALQSWLQHAVVCPAERGRSTLHDDHSHRASDFAAADAVVRADYGELSAAERLGVYSFSYFARLFGCMQIDFPAVELLINKLGEAGCCGEDCRQVHDFEALCRLYLTRHPSRTYTLNHLGLAFADFLTEATDAEVPHRALLTSVARLEVAMVRVFDAPVAEVVTREALLAVPQDSWADVRLRFIPALELLTLDHRADRVVTAIRREQPLPSLGPEPAWICVFRPKHRVWRCSLPHPRYVLLKAFANGKTFLEAVEATAAVWEGSDDALESCMFRWMQDWVADGVIAEIIL